MQMQKSNCLSQIFLTNNFSNEMRAISAATAAAAAVCRHWESTQMCCSTPHGDQ